MKNHEAVHCITSEQWDYVLWKNPDYLLTDIDFECYTDCSVIVIKSDKYEGCYCTLREAVTDGYNVLSFEQWCINYNHKGLNELLQGFNPGDYSNRPIIAFVWDENEEECMIGIIVEVVETTYPFILENSEEYRYAKRIDQNSYQF